LTYNLAQPRPIITYPTRGTTTALTDLQTWRGTTKTTATCKAHTLDMCVPKSHPSSAFTPWKQSPPPTSTYLEVGPLRYKNLTVRTSTKCTVCYPTYIDAQRSTFLDLQSCHKSRPQSVIVPMRGTTTRLTDFINLARIYQNHWKRRARKTHKRHRQLSVTVYTC
jgi:hypothetical protein